MKYKAHVLRLLDSRAEKFTPAELKNILCRKYGLQKKETAALIRTMAAEGELSYADLHGRTVIDISYNRPVRISPRIFLIPADIPFVPGKGQTAVRLLHGVSFGTGQHPTTRMSLAGLDLLLEGKDISRSFISDKSRVLDIGTGSGVLAIAALKLGITRGIGLDIDPCAIAEARENARINGLSDRLEISARSLEEIKQPFDLICANLRLPTLKSLQTQILRLAAPESGLLISGIHPEEVPVILKVYRDFRCIRQQEEKNWAMLAFARKR